LAIVAPALAWQPSSPPGGAPDPTSYPATDPGWYRAGETPRYRPQYQSDAAAGANAGHDQTGFGWTSGDTSSDYAAPDQGRWVAPPPSPTGDFQPWQESGSAPQPDNRPWTGSQAPVWYQENPTKDYRFRGDDEKSFGSAPTRDFGGYRFRDDKRLGVVPPLPGSETRYRFRPLEPDAVDSPDPGSNPAGAPATQPTYVPYAPGHERRY
jgi:hypothetical protein